jgi:hypothetical protein
LKIFKRGFLKPNTKDPSTLGNFKNPKPPQNQRTDQHWFFKIPRESKKEFQIRTEEQGRRKIQREIDQKQRRETNKGRTKMKSNKTS